MCSRLVEGSAVEVYVGPDKKMYTLPRALLCYHSDFFQRSLTGQFREASEDKIYLPEDDAKIFLLVLEWMYKGTLPMFEDRYQLTKDLPRALRAMCYTLCEMYCLADKLLLHRIQNYIFSQLDRALNLAGNDFPMTQDTIIQIYKNTHESSTLRKWVVEKLALNLIKPYGRHISEYQKLVDGPNAIPGFAVDLFANMKEVKSYDVWGMPAF